MLRYRTALPTDPIDPALADHPCHVLYDDDGVVAYVGLVRLWDGVAEAWLRPGPRLYRSRRELLHRLPTHIETYMKFYGLHRLHIHVRPENRRFAELVGFVSEGILVGHDADGSDHHVCRYAGVA